MSQVIDILVSLGINKTVYFQFIVFGVAFLSMYIIAFKPYLAAYNERLNRTVGGQEEAEKLIEDAALKEEKYKEEAKKLNSKIRSIFSEKNDKAKSEIESILKEAKVQAEAEAEAARQELEACVIQAKKEMEKFIPSICENIENKFVRH